MKKGNKKSEEKLTKRRKRWSKHSSLLLDFILHQAAFLFCSSLKLAQVKVRDKERKREEEGNQKENLEKELLKVGRG